MGDLLTDYLNIIREFTDAPDIFLQSCAYHVISTTLGQYFGINNAKIKRPNTWFVLSSIPGRTRRSTVCNFNEQAISRVFKGFYKEKLGLNPREAEIRYNMSRIIDGSAEGIADAVMNGENEGINTFNVCNPEIGDVLRKISQGRSGAQGIDTLLSRLYYGDGYYANFSVRSKNPEPRFFGKGKYVTMFSSMQEPEYYLNKTMSRQGLLRRLLLVYVEPKDMSMDNWKSPFDDSLHKYQKQLDDYLEKKLLPMMLKFHDAWENYNENFTGARIYIPVNIPKNIEDKIKDIAYKNDEELLDNVDDFTIYQQTQWEHLTKLTAVSAIANGDLEGKKEANIWKITAKDTDFNRAKEVLEVIGKHTEKVLEDLGTQVIQAKRDKGIDRVYKQINRAGPHGIKHSDLLNNLYGINKNDLKIYVDTLSEANKIKILYPDSKKATKYIASCYF